MRFRVLGQLEIVADGRPVPLGSPKQRTLLAALLVDHGRLVTLDRLVDALWEDRPPATCRAQIHAHVSTLRRLLAAGGQPDLVDTVADGYVLRIPAGSLDLDTFDEQAGQARQLAGQGRHADAIVLLRAALALWRGPALDGFTARFARQAAAGPDRRRLHAAELLAAAHLATGREAEIVPELAALSAGHPLHEGLRAQLMTALHATGRTAEALAAFREGHRLAATELGIEPGERLRTVHEAILRGLPTAPPKAPPAAPPTAPPAPAGATPVPRFQLPGDVAAFVGRADERAAALGRLGTAQSAPVTLLVTGPAGVGKTAFATHLAHRCRPSYPDGQLYVSLRHADATPVSVRDALGTLLRGLGIASSVLPADEPARLDLYRTLLADRRVLVLLDDAVSAAQVRPLLPPVAGSALLVTSRSAVAGLAAYRVVLAPFSGPEALELLAATVGPERVAAERPAAERIVRRCGHLPLAVQIAGARLAAGPHRPLADLADALRDQRRRLDELAVSDVAVRATLASTDQGLSAPARRAYHLLSLTMPGDDIASWTVAALLGVPPRRAELVVDELVDVHLLIPAAGPAGPRYRLHALVRLYGREQARRHHDGADLSAATDRLHGGYLGLAQRAVARTGGAFFAPVLRRDPVWTVPEPVARRVLADPVAWFETEHQALVTVTGRLAADGRTGPAAALATSIAAFFESGNHFDDWRATHDKVLAAARRAGDRTATMAMLRDLGELHTIQDRYRRAGACYQEALGYARELGDRGYESAALAGLGHLDRLLARYDSAVADLARARRISRRDGNRAGVAYAEYGLGLVLMERRQWRRADRRFRECLTQSRAAKWLGGEARALRCLGQVRRHQGRYASAVPYFERARRIGVRLGDRLAESYAEQWLGDLSIRLGEPERGAAMLRRCLSVYQARGQRFGEAATLHSLAAAARALGEPGQASGHLHQALRIWEQIDAPYWLAETRRALAALADQPGPAG
ncbi:AfsR/SARP family transcriptional regulator [Polymorphospora rubra]|uniref:SARP family transcriptional regulator n=1 Tax=Polymorphospora rubra TaxID=338584 RepID=A0A810N8J9_9ACTN|nr:BTAD domain-containing putative transcriptional regulator [Polymorphospora rubra]BCJ70151.1 SARP family transcriptional regulator [Polymorphospora rubra]